MTIDEILVQYPGQKVVYQTSDGLLHLTPEGAQAQALHLALTSIEKISCKTRKTTLLKS